MEGNCLAYLWLKFVKVRRAVSSVFMVWYMWMFTGVKLLKFCDYTLFQSNTAQSLIHEAPGHYSKHCTVPADLPSSHSSVFLNSSVVEEGNIENMQGSGSWGPELRNTAIVYPEVMCSPGKRSVLTDHPHDLRQNVIIQSRLSSIAIQHISSKDRMLSCCLI